MSSEMDYVLKKIIFIKKPEEHQCHLCSKVCESQLGFLGITFKYREKMPPLQE